MDNTELRVAGFKRILVQLDESTRHKYCSQALNEDLQRVKYEVNACADSMKEARQVQDATHKLHASQRAIVSRELLLELEKLQGQLETATQYLTRSQLNSATEDREDSSKIAKTLMRQIKLSCELETIMRHMSELERLMPNLETIEGTQKKWWTKYIQRAVTHALKVAKEVKEERWLVGLEKTVTKMSDKWQENPNWHKNVQMQLNELKLASRSKKKRAIPLPDDETPKSNPPVTASQRTEESDKAKGDKARALLTRCSREVRTLRDKFELGAYDVNLSRIVTVVDTLGTELEPPVMVVVTTTLFTLVETVAKVVNEKKRRDRLACLESVLSIVLSSSQLQLMPRLRTLVEEYATNCRQSLEQLNQSESARTKPLHNEPWPNSHVRFR